MQLYARAQIVEALAQASPDRLLGAIKDGFVAYSQDEVTVANVSHLKFDAIPGCPGDACIKSGYVRGAEKFVVKVGSGFPNNPAPLSTSQGCMMVFSQRDGRLEAVLADDGHLTDVRTALAAVLAARELAPADAKTCAVVGTGVVATLVAQMIAPVMADGPKTLLVASRSPLRADAFADKLLQQFPRTCGFDVILGVADADAAAHADIVVTCTPSTAPVLERLPAGGRLVIALGADAKGKRELGADVVKGAACVVADSKLQCLGFGECASAVEDGVLEESAVLELGRVLAEPALCRRAGGIRTVVVDLTGVAVQDVVIADVVLGALPG